MTGPSEIALEILDGGLQTTIQDAGRWSWAPFAVPESGAADPWSLSVANLLVGNDPGSAALEMTVVGPTIQLSAPTQIALAGADLGLRLRGGRRLAPGQTHRLAAGDVLEATGAASPRGARAYLAIPGGIDVPLVLGSRSTCLPGAFGGLDGRPLQPGDILRGARRSGTAVADVVWPEPDPDDLGGATALRAVATAEPGLDALADVPWRVAPAADRVGIRLEAEPTAIPSGLGAETTTHGVTWGTIQVPPDGRPIVLGPDHQTTGGYRVVGVVITADRPRLGQLRPGSEVRLAIVDRAAAIEALRRQRAALAAGAATLREAARWEALAHGAGA